MYPKVERIKITGTMRKQRVVVMGKSFLRGTGAFIWLDVISGGLLPARNLNPRCYRRVDDVFMFLTTTQYCFST